MQIQLQTPHIASSRSIYSGVSHKGAAFGNAGFFIKPIQMVMDPINNSRLFELFVSDFLGMTFPRTVIETKKRGADMGRETLFREIVGGLTPVYVCGWLGSLLAFGLEKQFYNPKQMSFRAWIDSNLLNHFAGITQEVLAKANTVKDLKEGIVKTIVSQIQSTDGIHELPQFKEYFPEKGWLPEKVKERLVQKLTQYKPYGAKIGESLSKKQIKQQAGFIKSLAAQATDSAALTHRVALMHPDGFPYMEIGPRELTDILGKTKNYLDEFISRALGALAKSPNSALTEFSKKTILCRLLNDSGKSWLSKNFIPRRIDGVIPYMYKLKRLLVGCPLLATALFGISFARINNWLTSRRFEGEVFFPGERLTEESKRPGRVLAS